MAERDEELDLDQVDVAKVLLGDTKPKKKAKGKAKTKKNKDEVETKSSSKSGTTLPLSMLSASPEDIALYEAKLASSKHQMGGAKDYKVTIRFNSGDIINHKSFGTGFVVAQNGLNKIEVLFKAGRKLLITAPAGAGK